MESPYTTTRGGSVSDRCRQLWLIGHRGQVQAVAPHQAASAGDNPSYLRQNEGVATNEGWAAASAVPERSRGLWGHQGTAGVKPHRRGVARLKAENAYRKKVIEDRPGIFQEAVGLANEKLALERALVTASTEIERLRVERRALLAVIAQRRGR
jgi:hypothetical protein